MEFSHLGSAPKALTTTESHSAWKSEETSVLLNAYLFLISEFLDKNITARNGTRKKLDTTKPMQMYWPSKETTSKIYRELVQALNAKADKNGKRSNKDEMKVKNKLKVTLEKPALLAYTKYIDSINDMKPFREEDAKPKAEGLMKNLYAALVCRAHAIDLFIREASEKERRKRIIPKNKEVSLFEMKQLRLVVDQILAASGETRALLGRPAIKAPGKQPSSKGGNEETGSATPSPSPKVPVKPAKGGKPRFQWDDGRRMVLADVMISLNAKNRIDGKCGKKGGSDSPAQVWAQVADEMNEQLGIGCNDGDVQSSMPSQLDAHDIPITGDAAHDQYNRIRGELMEEKRYGVHGMSGSAAPDHESSKVAYMERFKVVLQNDRIMHPKTLGPAVNALNIPGLDPVNAANMDIATKAMNDGIVDADNIDSQYAARKVMTPHGSPADNVASNLDINFSSDGSGGSSNENGSRQVRKRSDGSEGSSKENGSRQAQKRKRTKASSGSDKDGTDDDKDGASDEKEGTGEGSAPKVKDEKGYRKKRKASDNIDNILAVQESNDRLLNDMTNIFSASDKETIGIMSDQAQSVKSLVDMNKDQIQISKDGLQINKDGLQIYKDMLVTARDSVSVLKDGVHTMGKAAEESKKFQDDFLSILRAW